jgi:hypothetical protein
MGLAPVWLTDVRPIMLRNTMVIVVGHMVHVFLGGYSGSRYTSLCTQT